MGMKKNLRADNTYMISQDSTDNPKLGAKVLSDGRESLFLDFYLGFSKALSKSGREYKKVNNKREFLRLYLWQAPRSTQERQQNKETLEIAKKIRYEKGQQMLEDSEGYRLKKPKEEVNLLDWMWEYYEKYTKGDKRHIKRAYTIFIDFLVDPKGNLIPQPDWDKDQIKAAEKKKAKLTKGLKLKPEQLTKEMVSSFTDYVQNRFTGQGPHTLYSRFKKIIKSAVDNDIMRKNPCNNIIIKIDNGALTKDILSIEEVTKLVSTHYDGENPDIRRAFIFCLYAGLRFCNVKDLTYSNVDYSNRLLKFEQSKTKDHSKASGVVIPLNESLLKLIGKPEDGLTKDSH